MHKVIPVMLLVSCGYVLKDDGYYNLERKGNTVMCPWCKFRVFILDRFYERGTD